MVSIQTGRINYHHLDCILVQLPISTLTHAGKVKVKGAVTSFYSPLIAVYTSQYVNIFLYTSLLKCYKLRIAPSTFKQFIDTIIF